MTDIRNPSLAYCASCIGITTQEEINELREFAMGHQPEPDTLRPAEPEDIKPGLTVYYRTFTGLNNFIVRSIHERKLNTVLFWSTSGILLNTYGALVAVERRPVNPPQGSAISNWGDAIQHMASDEWRQQYGRIPRHDARAAVRAAGQAALQRLWQVACSDTHQGRIVADLLEALQYGTDFRMDNFRTLDSELFNDCVDVLRLDHLGERNISDWGEPL